MVEVMSTHARVSTHATHASAAKEGLENAVWIDVLVAATATILDVLAAVVHPSLLLITQYCVSLSHLRYREKIIHPPLQSRMKVIVQHAHKMDVSPP